MSLELTVEDETHTADRLRSGEVLAAVSADPEPVQGCRTTALGSLRYAACASPDFLEQYFGDGVSCDSLARAPYLRFDRRDTLQARWAREAYQTDLAAPAHLVPSTVGFLDLTLSGLGWGLQPLALVSAHLEDGRLVELQPATRIDVKLYWKVARLPSSTLSRITLAVRTVAARELR